MQKKVFVISIIFIAILLLGGYFFYNAILKDNYFEERNDNVIALKENKEAISHTTNSIKNNETQQSSSEENIKKGNRKQVVVDQTLKVQKNIENATGKAKANESKKIDNIQEEILLEITLMDIEQNKLLDNVTIEFQYKQNNEKFQTKILTSDSNGIVKFFSNKVGLMRFQFFTSEFGGHHADVFLHAGYNEYKANLLKGGELIVRPFNGDGKVVEGLEFNIVNGKLNMPVPPFLYDVSKGEYKIQKMPVGSQSISFKALGYWQTSDYLVRIESSQTTKLEILMHPAHIIFFDFEDIEKPEKIYILKGNPSIEDELNPNHFEIEVISKSKNNLYEYVFDNPRVIGVTVMVDHFLTQWVKIFPDKDNYLLKLKLANLGELTIVNQDGSPVEGASIFYSERNKNGENSKANLKTAPVITDKEGKASLTDLYGSMFLAITVQHKDYVVLKEDWMYNPISSNSKILILKNGRKISGIVKCKGELISGANIQLLQKDYKKPLFTTVSGADGSFSFDPLADKDGGEYSLEARHSQYGVSSIEIGTKFLENNLIINLSPERSITIKLVDASGTNLPNMKVALNYFDNSVNDSINVVTNENGEYDFENLRKGTYYIKLLDEKLELNVASLSVPNGVVKLIAQPKLFKKLMVDLPNGGIYKGMLKIQANTLERPVYLNASSDGYYYLDLLVKSGVFRLEVSGYPIVILGPYDERNIMPNELAIHLKNSLSMNVVVMDELSLKPMPGVSVDLFSGNTKLQSLPTNENGQITFNQLSGKFILNIKTNNYAPYSQEIDILKNYSDLSIKLIKSGHLKGHLTFSNQVNGGYLFLEPNYPNSIAIDSDGNFLVSDMKPGEYTLSFKENFKDGRNVLTKVPNKIIIESEKTLTINLDIFKKED